MKKTKYMEITSVSSTTILELIIYPEIYVTWRGAIKSTQEAF
jgi:hypothetical protein